MCVEQFADGTKLYHNNSTSLDCLNLHALDRHCMTLMPWRRTEKYDINAVEAYRGV